MTQKAFANDIFCYWSNGENAPPVTNDTNTGVQWPSRWCERIYWLVIHHHWNVNRSSAKFNTVGGKWALWDILFTENCVDMNVLSLKIYNHSHKKTILLTLHEFHAKERSYRIYTWFCGVLLWLYCRRFFWIHKICLRMSYSSVLLPW